MRNLKTHQPIVVLAYCLLLFFTPALYAQVNTGGLANTGDHNKQVIGYVTQWDAWKAVSAGLPSAGALTQLNIDYSKYTVLNYSFFGVANDGSLHSGDLRNKSIYMAGEIQEPGDIFYTDVYSSWDLYILFGELDIIQYISSSVVDRAKAQGFEVVEGGTTWSNPGWGLYDKPLPLPLHVEDGAMGLLDLAHQNGVKVMASIGGWSMCKHFPEMAADPVKRARFITDCKKLIAIGFDGIDLDWEYPGFGGMNFSGSEADFANFTTLVQEIRDAIGSESLITAAMSAAPAKLEGFEWDKLIKTMDYFNMMTYDFNGGWSNIAGHNSPVYSYDGAEEPSFNWQSTLDKLNDLGVPSTMINMGCPFYGRGVVCTNDASVNVPTQKVSVTVQPDGPISTCADYTNWPLDIYDGTPNYFYIAQKTGLGTINGWTRHWDDQAKVPYLTNGKYFLSYDDEESIGIKAQFINDNNLAGSIIWTGYGDLEISGTATSFGTKLKRWDLVKSVLVNKINEVFASGDTGDNNDADDEEEPDDGQVESDLKIVGYFPYYQGDVSDIQYDKLTHIIYAFVAPSATGDGSLDAVPDQAKLQGIVTLAHANNVKVCIAVGGWTDLNNPGFEAIAASSVLRDKFADNLVALCDQYDLDGVDIDWEYPINRATDYASMLQVLANKLHRNNKVLSAAVPGGDYYGQYINIDALNALDFLNVMAYDGDSGAGHSPYSYAVSALDYWTGKGMDNRKTVLGVPFYSRPSMISYASLLVAGASENEDFFNGDYYNGLPTIKQKSELAKSYGGIMIWELSQDAMNENSLLSAIYQVVGSDNSETLTISANGPYVADLAQNISFIASATGGIAPYSYNWLMGDGTATDTDQIEFSYAYAAEGSYIVTLTVTDSQGSVAKTTTNVIISSTGGTDGDCWPVWVTGAYVGGSQVSYNGINYQAKWWTDGMPGVDDTWENMGVCDGSASDDNDTDGDCWPAWVAGAYVGGSQVSYNGVNYQAKWWTDGTPGADDTWENMGVCDDGVLDDNDAGSDCWPAWVAGAYVGASQVSHNGVNYQAKWWTDGTPGIDDTWENMGTCGSDAVTEFKVIVEGSFIGLVDSAVIFTAVASGGTLPYVYSWDFGDDATGSGVSAAHSYSESGIYTVTLTVTDNAGSTSTTNITATITNNVITLPNTPENFSAIATSSSAVLLNWTDNSTNEQSFIIQYSTDGSTWNYLAEIDSNTTSYSHSGLLASSTYYYMVGAQNAAGTSVFSTAVSVTTDDAPGGSVVSLPDRIMSGYWHTWDGGVPFIPLREVNEYWDVINIAFAEPVTPGSTDGKMMFSISGLSPDYTIDDFKADVKALQASGKKVVLSIGGYEGYFSLGSASAVSTFVSSIKGFVDEYGFDGIDIDLEQYSIEFVSGADPDFENPISPKVVNLIQALTEITSVYNDNFILSFAPETFYFQMGHTYYGGLNSYVDTRSGVYVPVIHALRDEITYVQAQLYNSGSMKGLDESYYDMGTVAGIVEMCRMAIEGFSLNGNEDYFFPGLRADQVVIGVPASASAAGSGQISDAGLQEAFNTLAVIYPTIRGIMTWSINWDAYQNSNSFAINNGSFLNQLKSKKLSVDFVDPTMSLKMNMKVYPNPTATQLTVEGGEDVSVYQIFSITGQKVIETKVSPIDVTNLNSGTYIIKASFVNGDSGNAVFIKK
ncbi:glycosyl hydrolase family 18 protein [Geofilum sp. OHC36d9]|uniref:glycosyl hydrolase family 18 protein n=1 Tax=Geofilum sp. OHC36d9 TaxID=3458413 RepID=UPI004033F1A6